MGKNRDHQTEPNSEMLRIRMTPTMRKAFDSYCEEENLSEASAGRLAIFDLIRKPHLERTGEKLEKPDINPQNWGKRGA
jgi:hypothetical protein